MNLYIDDIIRKMSCELSYFHFYFKYTFFPPSFSECKYFPVVKSMGNRMWGSALDSTFLLSSEAVSLKIPRTDHLSKTIHEDNIQTSCHIIQIDIESTEEKKRKKKKKVCYHKWFSQLK